MKKPTKNRTKAPRTPEPKTTRPQRAAAMNLDNPQARARVDLAIQMVGECYATSTIIRAMMKGSPENNLAPCSQSQAYDYYERAMQELQASLTESHAIKLAKAVSRLQTIHRKALQAGKFSDAIAAQDRLALHDLTPSALTASRAIHVTDQPLPERPAGSLTDEELLAIVRAKE